MHAKVHSFISCSQNLEKTQMFINRWTDKHVVEYPYNGMLLGNKKNTSVKEARCKRLYNSIYMKLQKRQNYSDRKQIYGHVEVGLLGRNWLQRSVRDLWGMIDIFYNFIVVLITLRYICQAHIIVHLKWVNFNVCKL